MRDSLAETLAAGPVFAVSCDVDWASEDCIALLLDSIAGFGIVPTVFATHASPVLAAAAAAGTIEAAIHPNFLAGSSHGTAPEEVIDTVLGFAPRARGSRSHAYSDSTRIATALAARGIAYDSSPVCPLQARLEPLFHWSGIVRLPVFWEDDVHWLRQESWDFEPYRQAFATPGLKIVDVHPFFFALNAPGAAFYESHKHRIKTLDRATAASVRHPGPGCAEFFLRICDAMQGAVIRTLGEICDWATVSGSAPTPPG